MNVNELVKQMLLSFNSNDREAFFSLAREYIDREKRMKHNQVAKELEKVLFDKSQNSVAFSERRFRNEIPIPRDSEKGFPLIEIQNYDINYESLIVTKNIREQLDQIVTEFKDTDILATYNLTNKKKILLCGKPGTGKTFSTRIISSILNIPLVYIRFDSIISSYLGETATNLRKVFDYIENGTWIVLFDEFDIIGKNRDDIHEHGEIKRVVNNFLQMMDHYDGTSLLFAATNHQYLLDTAIWRRFDDVIFFDLPNETARMRLIEKFIRPMKREQEINIELLVKRSKGLSPADIKMVAEEAMKQSIIESRKEVQDKHLQDSLSRFLLREKLRKGSKE